MSQKPSIASAGTRTDGAREFTVWAPAATTSVDLDLDGTRHPMEPLTGGWWTLRVPAEEGARYGYSLDGGPVLPDPAARRLPDGPHGRAQVVDLDTFPWTDAGWTGVDLQGATIYELHIGTFTDEGTLDAAIGRLDHLVDLGVDIVELMPVASFPGAHGWGYDGVAPFSVHEPYGGPTALQRFVDAAHGRGLAVALDVVHNHLGPDGNYLLSYGPYFTDRHHTPWGAAVNLDGPSSDEVRAYLVENVVSWLRDYHLDALRLDAVHELHDDSAVHVLESFSVAVDDLAEEIGRRMYLIAESDRNDPRTVTSRDLGGLGIDAQWADDVHHGLHVALTGESQGYYSDFAAPHALETVLASPFFHAGTYSTFRGRTHGRAVDPTRVDGSAFVASLQTHDQVGNRRSGDRLSATVPFRRLAVGAALLLTSPYTPMLFMGEEWAASTPWQYFTDHTDVDLAQAVRDGRRREFATHGWTEEDVPDPQDAATVRVSTLHWSEVDEGEHERMLGWYRALLALRRSRPDLGAGNLADVRVESSPVPGAFVVARGAHRVAVNLSDQDVDLGLGLPDGGTGSVVLLTLDATTTVEEDTLHLTPDSVVVVGPASE
ncbi:malto-oligosyltrehalose trehalohydrolase [Mobilicoccus pelagius]|uniref:Malto-oligosyltrehalose trehalohydrolase n=1 Tax=Mobilicoccus pelagius NBRC 104925 TaxID=1089455 RepID=H5UN34_9MICO|nr:malto-oligosyltrehalose trehalohydrolase [Mobilicoccus pelagius]GAB47142.1 malto-oligosyltrehalose trehalohydrolase [Mobilicoccus pelagius NBRC 104925]